MLSIAAMRVSNPDRSPVAINCSDTALTPSYSSRKLMKSRKDNNDIENEAGHSEHDQSLVTPFASRQRPDEKDRPEECMKCEVGRSGQLAVEHGNFADTYQNGQEAEGEEPDTMRVETFT